MGLDGAHGSRSIVIGCGAYLPEKVVTNRELALRVDTTDEWITERTGIKQRHIAADGELTSHLGTQGSATCLGQCWYRRIRSRFDRVRDQHA